MSSKYDVYDIFRNVLMTRHNNYAIFKNNETLELLEFFKIYKKSNFDGEFTNMTLSNDFKQLFDVEPYFYIQDMDPMTPMNNYTLYESIIGEGFSISYNCKDKDIIFNTKKGQGTTKWDSQFTIKEFAMTFFEKINFNFDIIKQEMSKDENKILGWLCISKTKDNQNSLINIEPSLTLINVYLINISQNPILKTETMIDELITKIKEKQEIIIPHEFSKIESIVKETQNYITMMDRMQFVQFLLHKNITGIKLPRKIVPNNSALFLKKDIIEFAKSLPYSVKGITAQNTEFVKFEIDADNFKNFNSYRLENKSITINGNFGDNTFLMDNHNLFLFGLNIFKKLILCTENLNQQKTHISEIVRDFDIYYNNIYKQIFKKFNEQLIK